MGVPGAVLCTQKSYKDKPWIYHYKTLVEVSRHLLHTKISDVHTIKKRWLRGGVSGAVLCTQKSYKDKPWIYHYKTWLRCQNILHIQISDVHTIIERSWKWTAFCLLLKCLLRIKKHKKVYFKDKSKFHQTERNKEVRLAKSSREWNLKFRP